MEPLIKKMGTDTMRFAFVIKPYIIDPLGIGYISAILKANGHVTDIFLADEHLIANLKAFNPSYLCYSVSTGEHTFYLDLNREIKRHIHAKSLFGGSHPTFFPDMVSEDGVDAIFQGEAEETILNYLQNPQKINKPARNPENLDALPFPDRELIYKFRSDNPIKNIMTTRGCPFSCAYCYNSNYKKMFDGKAVRFRSIDSVVEEAKELKANYPSTKFIFMEDDEFAVRVSRLREFKRKWIGLPYHAQLRIEQLTEEKARLLAESGCHSVTFAIESANEQRRHDLLNRKMTNQQILDGALILNKFKIKIRTECMIGQPNETIKEALATLDLSAACKPVVAWASLYQPYPRTELGDHCLKLNLWDGDVDAMPDSFFEYSVLDFPQKLKNQFVNLQRLFSLAANYKIVRAMLPVLIKLPPNKLYDWIHQTYKKHLYDRKLLNV